VRPLGAHPSGAVRAWPRVGGHLALDLANTVSWRLQPERTVDYLTSAAALADWVREVDPGHQGVLNQASTPAGERALREVRALRDATIAVLDAALVGDSKGSAQDRAALAGYGQRAITASSLHPGLPSRWAIEVSRPDDLVHHLALLTVTLLQSPSAGRIGRCEGPGCGWFFLDTTRNHSRRWCAAGDCGNRVRVRNYTQRRRNPTPG
jgi:predicted RNA-binding Zn ribbon-like protein